MASTMLLRTSNRLLAPAVRLASERSLVTTCVMNKDKVMNDPVDHATGPEKYELLARQAGNDDPFFMKAVPRGKGTKEEPNIIDALDSYRMVGCICHEDDTHINWMWLFEGKPKRCGCGYWFELKHHPAPDRFKLPL